MVANTISSKLWWSRNLAARGEFPVSADGIFTLLYTLERNSLTGLGPRQIHTGLNSVKTCWHFHRYLREFPTLTINYLSAPEVQLHLRGSWLCMDWNPWREQLWKFLHWIPSLLTVLLHSRLFTVNVSLLLWAKFGKNNKAISQWQLGKEEE